MDEAARKKWDSLYASPDGKTPEPSQVLSDNRHLLPVAGKALDLACGRGGNALLLARSGLDTAAWDISGVALDSLAEHAAREGLPINCVVRDVSMEPPEPDSFDVIVVSRFLDRNLFTALMAALKSGGLVFYQTFTREKAIQGGPSNPDYLLATNELLAAFAPLRILSFRDEGGQGDLTTGLRNESWIIAKKERN